MDALGQNLLTDLRKEGVAELGKEGLMLLLPPDRERGKLNYKMLSFEFD